MGKKLISILLCSLVVISLMGCVDTTKTATNTNSSKKTVAKERREMIEKEKDSFVAVLESNKTYEEMSNEDQEHANLLILYWKELDQGFKGKYKDREDTLQSSKEEFIKKEKRNNKDENKVMVETKSTIITNDTINLTIDKMKKDNDNVIDAAIKIKDDEISIGIQSPEGLTKESAEAVGESLVKRLANKVASSNNLEKATNNTLGGIYDYYTVFITVGSDKKHIIADGVANKKSQKMYWNK